MKKYLPKSILLQHPSEGNCINIIIVGTKEIKYFLIKIMKIIKIMKKCL